jgi:hypothetical protein
MTPPPPQKHFVSYFVLVLKINVNKFCYEFSLLTDTGTATILERKKYIGFAPTLSRRSIGKYSSLRGEDFNRCHLYIKKYEKDIRKS